MYAPRVSQGFHVPPAITPFLLAVAAILATVASWAVFMVRTTSNETGYAVLSPVVPESVRSVAYALSEGTEDTIFVRRADGSDSPRAVASFSSTFVNLHIRGSASPAADRLAVLRLNSVTDAGKLAFVDLPSGGVRDVEADFDYLSAMAWAHDGGRIALTRTSSLANSTETLTAVSEVTTASGAVAEIGRFEGASQVVPVGYSLDGERVFVVVVDQSGSALWSLRRRQASMLTRFSAGPTRDWSLSPDGTRLAFVDRLGVGERAYAGRILMIATEKVTDAADGGNQLGAVWRRGAATADFGGPDGSLMLTEPSPGAYVLPLQWSPDGSTLAASVFAPPTEAGAEATDSVEIVTSARRLPLSERGTARFLGFVRDGD